MTSPEASATKRRADVQQRMFNWSKGHVTAHDLVARKLVEIPTVVRISTAYVCDRQPDKYSFAEGTLYLARSVRYKHLVVARTAGDRYVTIPRDSRLLFHLISNDDTLANAALTLSDILGGGSQSEDEGPCNGQRVQLSSRISTTGNLPGSHLPREVRGTLALVDVYRETFLLCHAFVAGSLSSKLTVIPAYLPVNLLITRSMTTGGDLKTHISRLCQLVENSSSTEELQSYDLSDIAVFNEPPNNHYEWIEPPPAFSKPVFATPPADESNPTPVLMHSVSNLYVGDTVAVLDHTRRQDGGRLSLEHTPKRPLPPIPATVILTESERTLEGRNTMRLYNKKYDTGRSNTVKVHHKLLDGSKSNPLSRAGSVPNLMDPDNRAERLSSSQSLEGLNIEIPAHEEEKAKSKQDSGTSFFSLPRRFRPSQQASFAGKPETLPTSGVWTPRATRPGDPEPRGKTPVRPPPPTRSRAEQIVYNHLAKSKRNSTIRRQRPITPGMRRRSGAFLPGTEELFEIPNSTGSPDSANYRPYNTPESPRTFEGSTVKELARHIPGYTQDSSFRQGLKPRYLELQTTSAGLPVKYDAEEGIYDSIKSPTYTDMSRSSTGGKPAAERFSPTQRTSPMQSSDSLPSVLVNDLPTASQVVLDADEDDYVNASDVRQLLSTNNSTDRTSGSSSTKRDSENSEQKEMSIYLVDEDDGTYCMPHNDGTRTAEDVERGQGVGAEMEDRSHYTAKSTAVTFPGTTPTKPPRTFALQDPPPDLIGYPSLDEIPTDMTALSVEEVLQCLRWLNLHKHVERFRSEQIDGELLMSVDQQVLIEELGFKRFDAIKLEKFARHGWRPKLVRASPILSPASLQTMLFSHGTEPLYTDV